MARKLAFNVLPVIIAIAVVLLVLYLVTRPDSSPFAKGVQWLSSHIEGFSSPIMSTPTCPGGFRFFNDNYGESFCCKGKVNPYTHRCEAKADAAHEEADYTAKKSSTIDSSDGDMFTVGNIPLNECKAKCDANSQCNGYSFYDAYDYTQCSWKTKATPIRYTARQEQWTSYTKTGTHTVTDANLCAFKDNVPDPRKRDGTVLPTCGALTHQTHKENENVHCPESLPNYASIGKCCKMGADLDGHDCVEMDNADTTRYCVTGNPTKAGEQRCDGLRMSETAMCPKGLQKTTYAMGDREVKKYGTAAQGKTIPICFSMYNTCIPDSVIDTVQKFGIYTDKTPSGWKYACSGYEKVNVDKDLTGSMDVAYI